MATDGEVFASKEAILHLSLLCELTVEQATAVEPVMIASKDQTMLKFDNTVPPATTVMVTYDNNFNEQIQHRPIPAALQPYESLRMHCKSLNHAALARLHLQMALYVHPVIRGDELALSAAIQDGKISKPTEALESRHRAEAELRSVFTMFIKAVLVPKVTGIPDVDNELYKTLGGIMHVTSRELDRYSGHLRQFVVDDKGVVLIATFGLRGSTFPNMVTNNCLPAAFAIHRSLKSELNVDNRIGATFGKVYCGVVGGVRRHEFAVMGAPVNLAARLMSSKVNKAILVDEAVKKQAGTRFAFRMLPPVKAKGYDKPVPILEPLQPANPNNNKKKKSSFPFIGRSAEKVAITSTAFAILQDPARSPSSMVFLMGESGMGKSALAIAVIDVIKQKTTEDNKSLVAAKSTSTETEQRIPLSSFRKVFLNVVRIHLENEGTLQRGEMDDSKRSLNSKECESAAVEASRLAATTRPQPISKRARSDVGARNSICQSSLSLPPQQQNGEAGSCTRRRRRPSLTRSRGMKGDADFSESNGDTDDVDGGSGSSDDVGALLTQSLRHISEDLCAKNNATNAPHPLNGSMRQLGGTRPNDAGRKFLRHSLSLSQTVHNSGVENSISQSIHRVAKFDAARRSSLPSSDMLAQIQDKAQTLRSTRQKTGVSGRNIGVGGNSGHQQRDDSSTGSMDVSIQRNDTSAPYFEKLCWVCEELDYPYEYADIVGSQFLGLESASPVTHVDGHVPTMDELVEFLALAFICIANFADLTVVFLDDFQWVDAFSWKIFRVLCKRGKKMLLMCATRSHDKQALRRMSTAVTQENQLQSQTIEISLGPLDFSEIRDLMSCVLSHEKSAIPEALCADIFQRTGGLPVYVIQVLENIKRRGTLQLCNGILEWSDEGLKEKRAITSSTNGAVMEETFLSRFDTLDVRVRKVLQTSAVLGLSFALTDVIQVHPEMDEADIEDALDTAVDEMILVEQVEDDGDENGTCSTENGGGADAKTGILSIDRTLDTPVNDAARVAEDRFFQFSHAMWRKNVLSTMLKERKIELHRLIAESMEKDGILILEQSDISRLLTLFEHWKACGDFCKSAPLALTVGARLEEWDLSSQSLELYEDALELSFDSVQSTGNEGPGDAEWVQVKARPVVLDLILRLHICIGLCHQRLGDPDESVTFFEDAYNIIKTASKMPGMSKSLMMPVISSLCVLKLEETPNNAKTKREQEKLLQKFVEEARENGSPVHISRALALQAVQYVRIGDYGSALSNIDTLESVYDFDKHSMDMIAEYGRDFGLECLAEKMLWLYLEGRHSEAEEDADMIVEKYLPRLDPASTDDIMHILLPVIEVFKLTNRAKESEELLKKYVINPYHDYAAHSQYWTELFNPLAYLLEVMRMEETEEYDPDILELVEAWVLDKENGFFSPEMERRAHTYMGELCWRLAFFKDDDNSRRDTLIERAQELLEPVARFSHAEVFVKHTARALLKAL